MTQVGDIRNITYLMRPMPYRLSLLPLLLLLSVIPTGAQAQTDSTSGPYHLSLSRELVFGIGAGGARWLGHEMRQRSTSILLKDLRLRDVPFFDRYTPNRKHSGASHASDFTLEAASVLPVLLLAGRRSRRDIGKIGLLFVETMALNQGMTDIIKATTRRPRPYLHDRNLSPDLMVSPKDRIAFVSGHTSVSAASCFFFGRVFADYYPESKLKPYVWGVAATLPAVTAYLRLRAGQHYPSDVVAGYLLGAAIGYGVPALHRRPLRGRRWRLTQAGTGVSLVYRLGALAPAAPPPYVIDSMLGPPLRNGHPPPDVSARAWYLPKRADIG